MSKESKPEVISYLDLWKQREDTRAERDTLQILGEVQAERDRYRQALEQLQQWVDTEGRNCPSDLTIDAVLSLTARTVTR